MMNRPLQKHNIVLLGVGHTNAHIVKKWRMKPIDGANLICVSNYPSVTYSGMLPGVLSGQYRQEEMEIDLVRLCSVSGARLIVGEVTGIDRQEQTLLFRDRPPLAYDFLSVGVGSQPSFEGIEIDDDAAVCAIKPMQTFLARLRASLDDAIQEGGKTCINIVGAGVGGLEIAFCLNKRIQTDYPNHGFEIRLIAGSDIGVGLNPRTRNNVRRELNRAGVEIIEGAHVRRVTQDSIVLGNGSEISNDLALWATAAIANKVHESFDLEKDDRGFFLTKPTLQSVSDDRIFAVGDSGSLTPDPTPKAGVYAVRQGPILWENFRRAIAGQSLLSYQPQKGFLKLLNLGDDRAIAEYVGQSLVGAWCWKLKDHIDRKFMKMYQDYKPMKMSVPTAEQAESAMRCLGCGGKIGGSSLSKVLSRLDIVENDDVLVGLSKSDDAAIVRVQDGQTTVTTDFFAAPFEDPYVVGRIAALNSASDCFAMNARPSAALTIAQVPTGHPRSQSEVLFELMAGAQKEFDAMGASIVGGHSIEGPRMICGFTILSRQLGPPTIKSGLQPGDRLVITKPIGSGVLLAAHMQGRCHAAWYQELVRNMLLSNEIALSIASDFSIGGMTDITGFGLAGHLLEMLDASGMGAEIELDEVPLLPGADSLAEKGIESTMTPQNRERAVQVNRLTKNNDALIYDPQTCGGLLIGVSESRRDALLERLRAEGFVDAADIGSVRDMSSLDLSLTVK